MKKKVAFSLIIIAAINVAIQMHIHKNSSVCHLTLSNIESLTNIESLFDDCIAGGPGATSCSMTDGIEGIEGGGSVSCGGGYWACCSIKGCHCRK